MMSPNRAAQLTALRNRLNALGDAMNSSLRVDFDHTVALDTYPHGNASAWNRKRIRIRNRINARLGGVA